MATPGRGLPPRMVAAFAKGGCPDWGGREGQRDRERQRKTEGQGSREERDKEGQGETGRTGQELHPSRDPASEVMENHFRQVLVIKIQSLSPTPMPGAGNWTPPLEGGTEVKTTT